MEMCVSVCVFNKRLYLENDVIYLKLISSHSPLIM